MDPNNSSNAVSLLIASCFAFALLSLAGCNTGNSETSDPVQVSYPVVYIERDIYLDSPDSNDDTEPTPASFSVLNPTNFNPGAALILKESAAVNASSINLTQALFSNTSLPSDNDDAANENPPRIDIRDLSVSEDGQQFLVSIRAPQIEDADDDEQPKWNIWHYSHHNQQLKRVMLDDSVAEQGDDLMPSFLPDGRIIFASNRQQLSKAILLDEGKSQYLGQNERQNSSTFNLHVMQADGSAIKQISYNLSHDFYPLVMQNGKVLYSRWDAMGGINKINLYQMNPDGTDNHLVYGWHSQQLTISEENDGQRYDLELIKAQQLADGRVFFLLSSPNETSYQKWPVVINIEEYIDERQSVNGEAAEGSSALSNLFASASVNSSSSSSNGQVADPTATYNFSEQLNQTGRVNHIFPLPDDSGRYLLSLDLCKVVIDERTYACSQVSDEVLADEATVQAAPAYELWLFNQSKNTQQLVARPSGENNMITEAILLQPSLTNDEFIADKTVGDELDLELYNQEAAALHIRSVYDLAGEDNSGIGLEQLTDPSLTTAEQRPARFLRVLRSVPRPSSDVRRVRGTDYGRSSGQLMREIVGYTPIQPDGSVKVKVPAHIPIAISVVDSEGKRIGGRHRQWISLKAGETLECNGCHSSNNTAVHGRMGAEPISINAGALSTDMPFPNTNQNISAQFGQTMAETAEQHFGLPELDSDLIYQDIWTEPTVSALNPALELTYSKLETPAPNGSECFQNWLAYCRIQINYQEHIAPLWTLEREVVDAVSGETTSRSCTSCHSPADENSLTRVPAAQLDLSNNASNDQPLHLTSYRELFFNDVEQELIEGILSDRLVEDRDNNGDIIYVTVTDNDEESETFGQEILALDDNGDPIPVLTTVRVLSTMSTGGARSSTRFFNSIATPEHDGLLTPSEIRLISEWLDIGGQYYNTPFYPLP